MTAPYHPGQSLFHDNPVTFADLHKVRADQIRTHWDVSALIQSTEAEHHADLDAMQALRARKLGELPEIAAVLRDLADAFGKLKAVSRHLRKLQRMVDSSTDETAPTVYAERVYRGDDQQRYRLDVCRRALAIRREREALRGRGLTLASDFHMAAE